MAIRNIADYSNSITSVLAALPATFTEPEIIEFNDASYAGDIGITGFVTSAVNYLEFRAVTGAEADGRPRSVSGRGARITSSTGTDGCIRIAVNHFRMNGLEVHSSHASGEAVSCTSTRAAGANDIRINGCFLHNVNTAGEPCVALAAPNLIGRVTNSWIYTAGRGIDTRTSSTNVKLVNNLILLRAAQLGLLADPGQEVRNNYIGALVAGAECFWTGGGAPTGSHNASSDLTAAIDYATGSLTNRAAADVVVSTTAGTLDLRLKEGTNPLVNAGVTHADVATDAFGTARPQGAAPDIGPMERVEGGGTSTVTSAGAIASGEAFGTHSFSLPGSGTSVSGAGGIASGEAIGSAMLTVQVERTTDIITNNTGTVQGSTSVEWSWFHGGNIGAMPSTPPINDPSAMTEANGTLKFIKPTGAGFVMVKIPDMNGPGVHGIYYQEFMS